MKNVDKHSRCGTNGRYIVCPRCGKTHRVFHFSWCALSCHQGCGMMIEKYDWLLLDDKSNKFLLKIHSKL